MEEKNSQGPYGSPIDDIAWRGRLRIPVGEKDLDRVVVGDEQEAGLEGRGSRDMEGEAARGELAG